ncbi:hypothetical protein [Halorarius halobius]|uniref:hypothetical protein n=1 Tax=Halorarius halobius TaxID=2962671 RepID=UPI0020CE8267|nr:hypothetical protein [Halorarius halobius]
MPRRPLRDVVIVLLVALGTVGYVVALVAASVYLAGFLAHLLPPSALGVVCATAPFCWPWFLLVGVVCLAAGIALLATVAERAPVTLPDGW